MSTLICYPVDWYDVKLHVWHGGLWGITKKSIFVRFPWVTLIFTLICYPAGGLIWFDVMSSCVFGADTGFALISSQMGGEGDHSERDRWKWRCSPLCQTGTVSITIHHQDTRYNSNGPLFLQPEKLDFWELASELVQMCGNPVTGCRLTAEWRNMGAVEEALIAI